MKGIKFNLRPAEMFSSYKRRKLEPYVDEDVVKKHGLDSVKIHDKLEHLYMKWINTSRYIAIDTNEGRWVASLLKLDNLKKPLTLAIIADDLAAFKQSFTKKEHTLSWFLFACACGAQTIGEHFLDHVFAKKDLEPIDRRSMLMLVGSSTNTEWFDKLRSKYKDHTVESEKYLSYKNHLHLKEKREETSANNLEL